MIRYSLACDQAHDFESWFASSASFDEQKARGFVTCPVCGSAKVDKRLMAPSLARSDRAPALEATPSPAPPDGTPQPVAMLSEPERQMRALLRAVREHVMSNSENVGTAFAEEARKIHYGEAEHRSIYGQATPADARALIEEGVDFQPLPILPDDRN